MLFEHKYNRRKYYGNNFYIDHRHSNRMAHPTTNLGENSAELSGGKVERLFLSAQSRIEKTDIHSFKEDASF